MDVVIFTPIRLFGEALCTSLSVFPEISDVHVCRSADRVADAVAELGSDIVLFDVTHEIALVEVRGVAEYCPGLPIIAVAVPEIARDIIECADAGFTAYIPRDASIDELRTLMKMALRGETPCHPKVVTSLFKELRRRGGTCDSHEGEPLTRRESEILKLVGHGSSNKEVARLLTLSESTIKAHMHSIFAKLRVRGRGEAIARLRSDPWLERSVESRPKGMQIVESEKPSFG